MVRVLLVSGEDAMRKQGRGMECATYIQVPIGEGPRSNTLHDGHPLFPRTHHRSIQAGTLNSRKFPPFDTYQLIAPKEPVRSRLECGIVPAMRPIQHVMFFLERCSAA